MFQLGISFHQYLQGFSERTSFKTHALRSVELVFLVAHGVGRALKESKVSFAVVTLVTWKAIRATGGHRKKLLALGLWVRPAKNDLPLY